ncbi:hypothetical protein BH09MYX1_BH09MYX1_09390 [soil metagenome]
MVSDSVLQASVSSPPLPNRTIRCECHAGATRRQNWAFAIVRGGDRHFRTGDAPPWIHFHAPPREEERGGLQRLDAALGFIEAKLGKPLEHPPLPIAFDKLRVPVGDGTKLIADTSVAEIAADSTLTSGARNKPKTAARVAIEKALAAIASLAKVHVTERNGNVNFEGVPLAALAKFGRAVAAAS